VLKILKRDKIWGGQFALASRSPNSEGLDSHRVIYVHRSDDVTDNIWSVSRDAQSQNSHEVAPRTFTLYLLI